MFVSVARLKFGAARTSSGVDRLKCGRLIRVQLDPTETQEAANVCLDAVLRAPLTPPGSEP